MKKKGNIHTSFSEAYTIKGIYQKEDGFWGSFEETQLVDVVHGINEKNNHEEAGELFKKQNKRKPKLNFKCLPTNKY